MQCQEQVHQALISNTIPMMSLSNGFSQIPEPLPYGSIKPEVKTHLHFVFGVFFATA